MSVFVKLETSQNPAIGEQTQTLETSKEWVKNLGFDHLSGFNKLSGHIPKEHTHAGLIYYMHYCWAKEHGCVIRPDMFWFTIVSEISREVNRNPEVFSELFTSTPGKKQVIEQTGQVDETEIDIVTLANQIRERIVSEELGDTIVNTRFESEDENAHLAICCSFAEMATPFFNYMTSLCGISSVTVRGTKSE